MRDQAAREVSAARATLKSAAVVFCVRTPAFQVLTQVVNVSRWRLKGFIRVGKFDIVSERVTGRRRNSSADVIG